MTKKKKEKRRKRDKIKMIKINKKMTMKRRSSPLSNPKEAEVLCIMKSYLPHEDRWLVHSMHSLDVTSLHRQSLTVYTVQCTPYIKAKMIAEILKRLPCPLEDGFETLSPEIISTLKRLEIICLAKSKIV